MPLPDSWSKRDVAKWWRDHFITSFEHEAHPDHWPRDQDQGVFAISLLCLSFCYSAAALLEGSHVVKAVAAAEFIGEYLGKGDDCLAARYRRSATALFYLFRHGLAHQREPGEVDLENGSSLGWILGREAKSEAHMVVIGPVSPKGSLRFEALGFAISNPGPRPKYLLSVQPDILYRDAHDAFVRIEKEIADCAVLAQKISKGVRLALEPRKIDPSKDRSQESTQRLLQRLRASTDSLVPDEGESSS
jgi:hypothetical protein